MTTPNLALPEIASQQAQPEIPINAALRRTDAAVNIRTLTAGGNTPPGSPAEGDRHVVGTSPTGAWAGQANAVAFYSNGGWQFLAPQTGWIVYDVDTAGRLEFNGTAWVAFSAGGGIAEAPIDGQTYGREDGTWVVVTGGGGGTGLAVPDGYHRASDFDDLNGWDAEISGTGAAAALAPSQSFFSTVGILELRTGTTTTGRAGVALSADASVNTPLFTFGTLDAVLRFRVNADPDSSFATDYVVRMGVGTALQAGGPTSVFELFTASGTWRVDRFGSAVDTSQGVSDSWTSFEIQVDATAEEIRVYQDGVLRDTFDNSGLGSVSGTLFLQIEKTSGTDDRRVLVDSVEFTQTYSRAF